MQLGTIGAQKRLTLIVLFYFKRVHFITRMETMLISFIRKVEESGKEESGVKGSEGKAKSEGSEGKAKGKRRKVKKSEEKWGSAGKYQQTRNL